MRNLFRGSIVAVAALGFSSAAWAQEASQKGGAPKQRPQTLYQKLMAAPDTGGPAPKRDLSGFWTGPLTPKMNPMPPLTPLGEKQFKANIPDPFSAQSNDPWATCDPFGFPRSSTNETRGIAFAQMPGRLVILNMYQRVFRTVWMDGRELPKKVDAAGAPDSRYYGYSIGHWDGDNTFVIETTGLDERTWLDEAGHPHTIDAKLEERWTRLDQYNIQVAVTVDDPKFYTKPFQLMKTSYYWMKNQNVEEELCIPSSALEYRDKLAKPSGWGPGGEPAK